MAHGYLREYDEGPDRDEDRGRWRDQNRESGWRGQDREQDWRGGDRNSSDRDRNFMFGDRDQARRREQDDGRPGAQDRGSREQGRQRNFASHQDDHYHSWREQQMQALDRDYQDYCRERERQFHSDFDAWRSQRRGSQEPLRTGMTQTSQTGDPTGALELTNEREAPGAGQPDPMGSATLGTNSSGQSGIG